MFIPISDVLLRLIVIRMILRISILLLALYPCP